jgi:hypothetical protein
VSGGHCDWLGKKLESSSRIVAIGPNILRHGPRVEIAENGAQERLDNR